MRQFLNRLFYCTQHTHTNICGEGASNVVIALNIDYGDDGGGGDGSET